MTTSERIVVPDQTWTDIPELDLRVLQVSGVDQVVYIHEQDGIRTLTIPSSTSTSWAVRSGA